MNPPRSASHLFSQLAFIPAHSSPSLISPSAVECFKNNPLVNSGTANKPAATCIICMPSSKKNQYWAPKRGALLSGFTPTIPMNIPKAIASILRNQYLLLKNPTVASAKTVKAHNSGTPRI